MNTLIHFPSLEGLHSHLFGLIDWHPQDPHFKRESPRTGLTPRAIAREGNALRMAFPMDDEKQADTWLRVLRRFAHGTPAYWEARNHYFGFNELDWWPLRVRKSLRIDDDCPGQWTLDIELGEHGYEVIESGSI